ncbi:MAG TPA: DUF6186 family protein [Acidimicrobiia bacterium]|nr:DUF6186 family protein [Acidimicrobiia bacterium]
MSRAVTIAGWIVIVAAIVAASATAVVTHGRFPSFAALLREVSQHVVVRVLLLAGWAWLGWHFFVRTSR